MERDQLGALAFYTRTEQEEMPPPTNHKLWGRWFVWDPCGIACAVATYILLVYGELVVLFVALPPFPSILSFLFLVVFTTLCSLAIISHLKAMFTDPGIVPHESASQEEVATRRQQGEDIRYCKKCRSVKPDRAHHCSTCERCISKMDHHCPWINNCVGENNQKYFVLFTFYVMNTSVFGLFLAGWFLFSCARQDFQGCDAIFPAPLVFIFMVFAVFEGFLFSLFTCIMFCTQVHAIITDETGIEQLKKEQRKRITWKDSLVDVFGKPGLHWLSPFTHPPYGLKRRISHLQGVMVSI